MVDAIRHFFEKHIKGPGGERPATKHDPLRVATAALLVEMMRMDGEITEDERQLVANVLEEKFALPPDDMAELMRLAETRVKEATDYYRFTALIKNRLSAEEKERLIEYMWVVAYADGKLHRYEEHLVRKIAELLYVPHNAFIAAKLRARDGHGRE